MGLKPPLQILFYNCLERKGCSKILKIPKKIFKTVSSTLTLQVWSLEFPASTKETPRKMFTVSILK